MSKRNVSHLPLRFCVMAYILPGQPWSFPGATDEEPLKAKRTCMNRTRWLGLFLVNCLLAPGIISAAEGETNSKPASPFGQGKADLAAFQIKRGFRLELVAADPVVASPVAMAVDENGRLFVAELRDPNRRDPNLGQIRVLQDNDGDGIFEASAVYAEEFAWPSAIACSGGGIFVAATPELIYLKDTAGDGVADVRRVVFNGFGGDPGAIKADALLNSFSWSLDNRIHGATAGIGGTVTALKAPVGQQTDLRRDDFAFDPRGLTLTPEAGTAQSGLAFDSRGRRFLCDYDEPLKLAMVEPRYAALNPYFPKGPALMPVTGATAPVFQFASAAAARGTNNLVSAALSRARGIAIYRGGLFPPAYSENVFIPDFSAGVIHRAVLRENGLAFFAERAGDELNTELLLSRDRAFQPTQALTGPDGALYVADWHGGGESGRIYRIVPENFKQPKRPELGRAGIYDVVAALANTNGWYRDTAARLLYERRDPAAVSLLTNMFNNSRLALARVHALHALDGLGALKEAHLLRALRDPDERLREHGVLLVESLARDGLVSDTLWTQLKQLAQDPSPRVQYQLACTSGFMRRNDKALVLAEILRRHFSNPWMQSAVLGSLTEGAGQLFVALANDARILNDPGAQPLFEQLLIMIGVRGHEDELAQVLNFVENPRLPPQQVFTILYGVGEGLRRAGASFTMVDHQNRLQKFYDQTIDASLNDSLPDQLRIAAIRFRGVSPYVVTGTGDFFQLLFGTGSGQSEAVQSAVITTLARYNNPTIPNTLLGRWQLLSPRLRNEAVAALLARTDGVPALMNAIESGRIGLATFSSVQLDFLRTYPDQAISQAALARFGPVVRERPDLLERFAPALRLNGTATVGRQIFQERCASCHRVGFDPQAVGPDLARSRLAGKEKILRSILAPNQEVNPDYTTYVVRTRGGENLLGLMRDENASATTLRQPNGIDVVLPRGNVETLQAQPWSVMPGGLVEGLTPQAMANLLEFIMTAPR
jgi:putative membrane-bound dehydrogenase-like protein